MESVELFDPDRHRSVEDQGWDRTLALRSLEDLVAGTVHCRGDDGLWPGEHQPGDVDMTLYAGAAGITWALGKLQERGYLDASHPIALASIASPENLRDQPIDLFSRFDVPPSESYLLGPVGHRMQLWQETRDPGLLDELHERIERNRDHPWMENLWGAPSTMSAALFLYEATGEARFAEQYRLGAEYLWRRLEESESNGPRLWNISLYGEHSRLLGAGHGFVGNVFAVLKGLALLDDGTQQAWRELAVNTTLLTAIRDDGLANWPPGIGPPRRGRGKVLVQHCHGAPGFILELSSLMRQGWDEFDRVLLEAGELVWRAGPLNKYPGLCHGTAGNGYALLKLFSVTRDERWLQRARAFAMSAIRHRHAMLESGEPRRFSLWEGDMGLALFIADCIEGNGAFPTMDYFFSR